MLLLIPHPGESGPSEMQPQPILAAREAKFNDLLTLLNFAAGNQDEDVNLRRKDRAPRFWVNATSGDAGIADFIVLGIGICFGAIHYMAWLFFTDSRTVVTLANIECRYNRCPQLHTFDVLFGCLANKICTLRLLSVLFIILFSLLAHCIL